MDDPVIDAEPMMDDPVINAIDHTTCEAVESALRAGFSHAWARVVYEEVGRPVDRAVFHMVQVPVWNAVDIALERNGH